MVKDSCYYQALKSHGKWSARAAQQTAKCRKKNGTVRKTKSGEDLKRWQSEKWTEEDGSPCGSSKKSIKKCRPSKRVSSKTPVTWKEISPYKKKKLLAEKRKIGMGKKTSPLKRTSPRGFHLTKKEKNKFLENPEINPLTGRKIKIGGPTYKKLFAECDKNKSPRGSLKEKPLYKPFPAKDGKHKYSVYVKSESGGRKIVHFGDINYQQYKDKIGHYSSKDHKDPKRRARYRSRHEGEQYDKNKAGWWAWHKLW